MCQPQHEPNSKLQEVSTQEFPVIYEQVVAWGDMDAFNHVNNVVYYRYAESARIDYLHKLDMFDDNTVLMLVHSNCHYLKPVFFPDVLHIAVRCQKMGNTSMTFECVFISTEQQAVVAKVEAVVVQMTKDATAKKAWTTEQRATIFQREKTVGHVPKS